MTVKNLVFSYIFLVSDISLNNLSLSMKLYRHDVKVPMEGTLSQIICIGPIFCFMKFRNNCFKNVIKVSLFSEKTKSRA